jgi:hypothetical protein
MLKTVSSLGFAAALLVSISPVAAAGKAQRGLDALEPTTRMIEVCDIAVSNRISKETQYSRVDRVVGGALADAVAAENIVTAYGAAFRDRGHWYGLRYSCTLSPDHTNAKSLRYAIGREIPESSWEQYGLWR